MAARWRWAPTCGSSATDLEIHRSVRGHIVADASTPRCGEDRVMTSMWDTDDLTWAQEWFAHNHKEAEPPFAFERITGGRSNLTYCIVDAEGRRYVLRRPPLSGVLPSAHDVGREFRVMRALRGSRVPVPQVIGQGRAPGGVPFYVMHYVDGLVMRGAEQTRAELSPQLRRMAASSMIDVLVTLHGLTPRSVGLADLGRGSGFLARQVVRWYDQWSASMIVDRPIVAAIHDRLQERMPNEDEVCLVHGDYRLDNVLLDPGTGEVVAVVDWELSTLGDPLVDLAVLLVYWSQPNDAEVPLGDAPTLAEGFPTRVELARWYGERSGRSLDEFDVYLAFAQWRLALVLEGIAARRRAGAYGDVEAGVPPVEHEARVAWLLDCSANLLGMAPDEIRRSARPDSTSG
ncbi:phosphotransferase family protein [Nitriliruptoraceae bacterium ZYF776]|nr:phosphotransferase family protein [Profundirhabdus halotolerans]